MTTTRRLTLFVTAAAVAILASSCGDSALAPGGAVRSPASVQGAAHSSTPSVVGTYVFTITPDAATYRVADYTLSFPAHAVCDPATSGYGEDAWNTPCATLSTPVTVTARVLAFRGRSWIDFSPNLRFAPSVDPTQWVRLSTVRSAAIGMAGNGLGRFAIFGSNTLVFDDPDAAANAPWLSLLVNDAARDRTLRTQINTTTGEVSRRIQHFSGYSVTLGDKCDPTTDPTCPPTDSTTTIH